MNHGSDIKRNVRLKKRSVLHNQSCADYEKNDNKPCTAMIIVEPAELRSADRRR